MILTGLALDPRRHPLPADAAEGDGALAEALLARRYLPRLAPRTPGAASFAAAAVLGLVLGVAALVVSLALLAGFQAHVLTRLAEEAPHVLVSPAGRPDFAAAEGAAEGVAGRLAEIPGVVVTPVVRGRGWITVRGQAIPAVLAGREGAEGIRLDPAQARQLSVLPGEDVTIVSSRTRLSPLGPVPVTVTLSVKEVGATATGRRQPEAVLPAETARRLFGLPEGGATGYELRLAHADGARASRPARGRRSALRPRRRRPGRRRTGRSSSR